MYPRADVWATPDGATLLQPRWQCGSCGALLPVRKEEERHHQAELLRLLAREALALLERSIDAAACRAIDALPPGEVYDRQADRIEQRADRACQTVMQAAALLEEYGLEVEYHE